MDRRKALITVNRVYSKLRNEDGIHSISIRSLSTQSEERNAGYTLSRKQRKALQLMQDDLGEGNVESAIDRMREESLAQDMEYEENNPLPWHSLLLYPSRALWRSSPQPPPPYILHAQSNIIEASERTPKQLRRTYDRIMANHTSLSERRERERRRMVNGTGYSANSLEAKKQKGIDGSVSPVYYKPEHTVCSLKYRLLPNYAITKRILAEIQSLLGKDVFKPKKILDVGVGAGSAAAAVLDYFSESPSNGDSNSGVDWIHGIDPSQSMRDASGILLSQVLQGQEFSNKSGSKTRITFGENLISPTEMNGAKSGGSSFDLALCAYTLNEIPSVAASLSMAAIIWEKLSPGGVAIFIEPGTPDGFNAVRSVRSMLLDCCPPDDEENLKGEEECHVIAPCTHNGSCPMIRHQKNFFRYKHVDENDEDSGDEDEQDDEHIEDGETLIKSFGSETDVFDTAFCSFVHVLPGGTQRKQGEKFAYLVVQKRLSGIDSNGDGENPFKDTNIVNLLRESVDTGRERNHRNEKEMKLLMETAKEIEDKFLDSDRDKLGLELVRGENRKSWGRIVRAPIKKKGHVIVDYCASTIDEEGQETGRIVRSTVSRAQSARAAPGMYLSSRKSRWGGLWPDLAR